MRSEQTWATAVRVLGLLCALLLVVTCLQAGTIRRARREVQELRAERDRVKAGVISTWVQQPVTEVGDVIRGLNAFYAEPTEGFGRPGGICRDSRLDERPVLDYLFGSYLPARSAGKSIELALQAMNTAILQSDEYRQVHPNLAVPRLPN